MNFSFFFFFLVSLFSIPFFALKENCTKGFESSKSIYLFLKKKEKKEDGWIIKRNYYWKNDLIQMKSCGVYIYIYRGIFWKMCGKWKAMLVALCDQPTMESCLQQGAKGKKGNELIRFIVITSVFSSPLLHHYSCSQAQSCWTGIDSFRDSLLLLKKL